jgi:hypothetical protein
MSSQLPPTVPFQQLLTRCLQVRNETQFDANTAQRIGQLFYDIVEKLMVNVLAMDSFGGEAELLRELPMNVQFVEITTDVTRVTNDIVTLQQDFVTLDNTVSSLANDLIILETKVDEGITVCREICVNTREIVDTVVIPQLNQAKADINVLKGN